MPDSLFDLEKRRSEVLAEISALGDFGPGSNFRHWRLWHTPAAPKRAEVFSFLLS